MNDLDIEIFPNPAREKFGVRSAECEGEEMKIEILDAAGRTNAFFYGVLNKDQMMFETSSFDPGMYFVRISAKKKTAVRKLIIQ